MRALVAYHVIGARLSWINKYRKSYERECISGFMSTSDVLKVLKTARAAGECNLRTFKHHE